jgi:hypothetical protein
MAELSMSMGSFKKETPKKGLMMKQTVTPKVDSRKIALSASNSKDNDEPFNHYQEVSSGGVSKYYTAKVPGGDNSLKSKTFDIRSVKGVSEIKKDKFDKEKQTGGIMPKFDRDSGTYTWEDNK